MTTLVHFSKFFGGTTHVNDWTTTTRKSFHAGEKMNCKNHVIHSSMRSESNLLLSSANRVILYRLKIYNNSIEHK